MELKQQLPETQIQINQRVCLSRTSTELEQKQLQLQEQYLKNLRDQRIKIESFAKHYNEIEIELNRKNQQLAHIQYEMNTLVKIVQLKDNQILQLSHKIQELVKNKQIIQQQNQSLKYTVKTQGRQIKLLQQENKSMQNNFREIKLRYLKMLDERSVCQNTQKYERYEKLQKLSKEDHQQQFFKELILQMLQQKHTLINPQKSQNVKLAQQTINDNIFQQIETKVNSLLQQKKLLNHELEKTKFQYKIMQNNFKNVNMKLQQLIEENLKTKQQQQKQITRILLKNQQKQKEYEELKIQSMNKQEQYLQMIKILHMQEIRRRKINDKQLLQMEKMQQLLQKF